MMRDIAMHKTTENIDGVDAISVAINMIEELAIYCQQTKLVLLHTNGDDHRISIDCLISEDQLKFILENDRYFNGK